MTDDAGRRWESYGTPWELLHCTSCDEDIHVYLRPKGGTVLACGCEMVDREEVFGELDEWLPDPSDCVGPLADDERGIYCHPWEFIEP